MQHTIRPTKETFTVILWTGDDLGVYRRTVRATSHPQACYIAASQSSDGEPYRALRRKAFRAVSFTGLEDSASFEGPLDASALWEGRVESYKPQPRKVKA